MMTMMMMMMMITVIKFRQTFACVIKFYQCHDSFIIFLGTTSGFTLTFTNCHNVTFPEAFHRKNGELYGEFF